MRRRHRRKHDWRYIRSMTRAMNVFTPLEYAIGRVYFDGHREPWVVDIRLRRIIRGKYLKPIVRKRLEG